MTNRMKPAYENGAHAVDENIEVLFSAAGTWSDPNKGSELAQAQYSQGADIILIIAGGTGVGVIEKAKEMGKYVIGVDSNIISFAPGTILACTLKNADKAMKSTLLRAFRGELPFGTVERWGLKEGVIGFTFDDPNYIEIVPESIREKMIQVYKDLMNGVIDPLASE